jgi:DNA-binding ferritin-like protein
MKDYKVVIEKHLCDLEGFKTKFKNLHWSAVHLTSHQVIGDLLNDLDEYQDTVAEISMGYLGKQFKPDFLSGSKVSTNESMTAVDNLTVHLDKFLKESPCEGITNAVNDFQEKLLKYKYLLMLTPRVSGSSPQSKLGTMV